ncbi:MAG: hypothetical protein AAGF96_15945 [Bacteroidota bacterium]
MRTIRLFGLLLIMGLFFTACSDDDPDPDPDPITQPDADPDSDSDPDPDTGLPSGWLTGYRVESPQGQLYYMEASENILGETNVSNAVELGFGARILSFGENPYTWNDEAGTLTKWSVDRTTLEFSIEGIISFASVGISGNVGFGTRFVSETKAYIPNIREGVIVEFNPSLMEITSVVNFDFPFPNSANGFYFNNQIYVPETEKFIFGINYFPEVCCEYDGPDAYTILVFDTATNTVEVKQDQRLLIGEEALIRSDDGFIYISPGLGQAVSKKYLDNVPAGPSSEFNVLRMDLDGNFDPDYNLDLESTLSKEFARAFEIAPSGNVRPFIQPNSDFADNWNDRFSIFGDFPEWSVVGVNYATGAVEPLTVFDGFNYVTLPSNIDGVDYAVVGEVEVIVDGDTEVSREISYFARVEDGFNLTLLTRNEGGTIRRVAKLW